MLRTARDYIGLIQRKDSNRSKAMALKETRLVISIVPLIKVVDERPRKTRIIMLLDISTILIYVNSRSLKILVSPRDIHVVRFSCAFCDLSFPPARTVSIGQQHDRRAETRSNPVPREIPSAL